MAICRSNSSLQSCVEPGAWFDAHVWALAENALVPWEHVKAAIARRWLQIGLVRPKETTALAAVATVFLCRVQNIMDVDPQDLEGTTLGVAAPICLPATQHARSNGDSTLHWQRLCIHRGFPNMSWLSGCLRKRSSSVALLQDAMEKKRELMALVQNSRGDHWDFHWGTLVDYPRDPLSLGVDHPVYKAAFGVAGPVTSKVLFARVELLKSHLPCRCTHAGATGGPTRRTRRGRFSSAFPAAGFRQI